MKKLSIVVPFLVVLVIGLAVLAGFAVYSSWVQGKRYPDVVEPGGAYLLTNGSLYLSVYNSWSKPVSISSIQVAMLDSGASQNVYSFLSNPNMNLGDGSVRILCCTDNGGSQTIAKSTAWFGGGNVPAGGISLLRFRNSALENLNPHGTYYLAIGNEWFPSSNLEPFIVSVSVNDSLPKLVPVRAIVYPNETLTIGVVSTGHQAAGGSAEATFILRNQEELNASYAVIPQGASWYRLQGGGSLPPYMPLNLDSDNSLTSVVVSGLGREPLLFSGRIVTQVPPIEASSAGVTASSWSSGSSTVSYAVQWQFVMNGTAAYNLPVTLNEGVYWINFTPGVEVGLGGRSFSSPMEFNTPYYDGMMSVTLPNSPDVKTTSLVTLIFGQPFRMPQTSVVSSEVSSQVPTTLLIWSGLVVLVLAAVLSLNHLRKPRLDQTNLRALVEAPNSNGLDSLAGFVLNLP